MKVRQFVGVWILALGLGILTVGQLQAAVQLHGLFTDGMVLQQGMKVPVWGQAEAGEKVVVSFQGQECPTKAEADGKWLVHLNPLKAGGPFTLTVQGSNSIQMQNVLVGEVWVASGQSNMEWSVNASRNPKEAIANSKNPQLRLFQVPKIPAAAPQSDFNTSKGKPSWRESGPATIGPFSAVGYFFAKYLQEKRQVPVGIIHCSWGGTAAERWTSKETFAAYPELKASKGSDLYNGMIKPLVPFAIRGAIWYQGESNAGRAYQYRTLFPAMIKNWRDDWKQGDFPFLFVQLAPYMKIETEPKESTWAELREAQLMTSQNVPHTAQVVITDLGDEKDIHPKDKDPVGLRLALCALALAHKEPVVYSGPVYADMKVEDKKVVLGFKHLGGGLVVKGDKLTGFTIAGKDRKFVNAEAVIAGDKVVVSSPAVAEPVAVRYGWANYPVVNLYNREGLPATPFRTDTFPGITAPKTKVQ